MSKKASMFVMYPYNLMSAGASALASALGCLRVREKGNYRPPNRKQIIINWGNPRKPVWGHFVAGHTSLSFLRIGGKLLNHWEDVENSIDKLKSMEIMGKQEVPIPEFTCNKRVAAKWMEDDHRVKVVCRTLLRASEGRGIVVATKPDELVDAKLYTRFFVKETEYRVHVFDGQVIDVQEKRLRKGALEQENRSQYIRNTANGWVFCRENVDPPLAAKEAAIDAVDALKLHFGAVDVAVNKKGQVAVFEVNTAPGLEGETIVRYAEAIKTYCDKINYAA